MSALIAGDKDEAEFQMLKAKSLFKSAVAGCVEFAAEFEELEAMTQTDE